MVFLPFTDAVIVDGRVREGRAVYSKRQWTLFPSKFYHDLTVTVIRIHRLCKI
jgi:hypothetical protein